MRRKPDDGPQEIKAGWGDAVAALEGLPLLAVGVALGVAGVLLAKLLSRDPED